MVDTDFLRLEALDSRGDNCVSQLGRHGCLLRMRQSTVCLIETRASRLDKNSVLEPDGLGARRLRHS